MMKEIVDSKREVLMGGDTAYEKSRTMFTGRNPIFDAFGMSFNCSADCRSGQRCGSGVDRVLSGSGGDDGLEFQFIAGNTGL